MALGRVGSCAFTSPAVANGVVYIEAKLNDLYAFSAAAGTSQLLRDGTKTCKPLWTGTMPRLNPG